jgi:hypothetical protein
MEGFMYRVGIMLLLLSTPLLFGQTNQIALEFIHVKECDIVVKYIDVDIDRLFFQKSNIKQINGLDKLKKLETIIFDMTAFITDFSFLKDTVHLKNLFFVNAHPDDWSFLEDLPYLEKLYIISCSNMNMQLNLANNVHLEYLEIKYSNLETFPELIHIPPSLKYLNLSNNTIRTIPKFYMTQSDFLIFLYQNKVSPFVNDFIFFDSPEKILPEKYIVYMG